MLLLVPPWRPSPRPEWSPGRASARATAIRAPACRPRARRRSDDRHDDVPSACGPARADRAVTHAVRLAVTGPVSDAVTGPVSDAAMTGAVARCRARSRSAGPGRAAAPERVPGSRPAASRSRGEPGGVPRASPGACGASRRARGSRTWWGWAPPRRPPGPTARRARGWPAAPPPARVEEAGAAAEAVLPSSVCPSTRSGVFGTARTCGAAAIPITVDGFNPLPMISAAVTHTTANPSKGRSCSPLTISSHPQTSRNGAYRTHASG